MSKQIPLYRVTLHGTTDLFVFKSIPLLYLTKPFPPNFPPESDLFNCKHNSCAFLFVRWGFQLANNKFGNYAKFLHRSIFCCPPPPPPQWYIIKHPFLLVFVNIMMNSFRNMKTINTVPQHLLENSFVINCLRWSHLNYTLI